MATEEHPATTPLELWPFREEIVSRTYTIRSQRHDSIGFDKLIALPPEILGEIFAHGIANYDSYAIAEPLQMICLVCRGWREVALATPELWSNLSVRIRKTTRFDRVRAWLSRAGTLPRKLGISCMTEITPPCNENCVLRNAELVNLLIDIPINFFAFKGDSLKCFQHLFDAVDADSSTAQRPWNALHTLSVQVYDWSWEGDQAVPEFHVFKSFPTSLTSLHLELPPFQLTDAKPAPFSLPNLKDVHLKCEFETWILESLNGSPNLEYALLNFDERMLDSGDESDSDNYSDAEVVCALPKLLGLQLKYLASRERDTRILRSMSCPSLIHLDLSFENNSQDRVLIDEDPDAQGLAGDVVQFVKNSNCAGKLKLLRLHSLVISAVGLIPIFRALHSVKRVIMEGVLVDAALFKQIDHEKLLPCLQTLSIHTFTLHYDLWKLIELIEARSHNPGDDEAMGPVKINKVTIVLRPDEALQLRRRGIDARLNALRVEGVDITLIEDHEV